jgi:hypothetical protein
MKKELKQVAIGSAAGVCVGLAAWGLVMVGTNLSYYLFYGDHVQQTIQETVKPECLKGDF